MKLPGASVAGAASSFLSRHLAAITLCAFATLVAVGALGTRVGPLLHQERLINIVLGLEWAFIAVSSFVTVVAIGTASYDTLARMFHLPSHFNRCLGRAGQIICHTAHQGQYANRSAGEKTRCEKSFGINRLSPDNYRHEAPKAS